MNTQTQELLCPKCQGGMRTYERNGIHIDQCEECRGIFLDRGELEQLMGAESSYLGADPSTRGSVSDYLPGGDRGHRGGNGKHGGKRRRGFLGELFD
jgi:Zn-finger nucleic acid-binding protein